MGLSVRSRSRRICRCKLEVCVREKSVMFVFRARATLRVTHGSQRFYLEKIMGVPQPIPPEIPVIPDLPPEIVPDHAPAPEIPVPLHDPMEPPGPDGPEIMPDETPPEAPPLPPEHVARA